MPVHQCFMESQHFPATGISVIGEFFQGYRHGTYVKWMLRNCWLLAELKRETQIILIDWVPYKIVITFTATCNLK